jgi:cysteinyl-tRNA synthetase
VKRDPHVSTILLFTNHYRTPIDFSEDELGCTNSKQKTDAEYPQAHHLQRNTLRQYWLINDAGNA